MGSGPLRTFHFSDYCVVICSALVIVAIVGRPAKLPRKLDFIGVNDHAIYMGAKFRYVGAVVLKTSR